MRELTKDEVKLVAIMHKKWRSMLDRCRLKSDKGYKNYGARGIKVSDEWIGADGFANFFSYVQALPNFGEDGYSLDRIDVNGNYEPGNVRWATAKVQGNNRRNNIMVEDVDGSMIALGMAAEKYGIKEDTLYQRYRCGYRGEKLFLKKVRQPLVVDGKTLRQLSDETGIYIETLRMRYYNGDRGKALTRPLEKKYSGCKYHSDR
jgi:hypothetical protein